jgi:hypothetical protein
VPAHYRFDFAVLPSNVKRQLRKSSANPKYLVHADVRSNFVFWFWHGLLILLCGLLLVGAVSSNFGDPVRDRAWSEKESIFWYTLLIFGLAWGISRIHQRISLTKTFGFVPGRYLFPFTLVDARSDKFTVYDLNQLEDLGAVHHHLNGAYNNTVCTFKFNDGSRQVIIIGNKATAENMLNNVYLYQKLAGQAFDQRDLEGVYGFDPFIDIRRKKWVGADAAIGSGILARFQYRAIELLWAMQPWLMLAALLVAALLWYGRNVASDGQMYQEAKQKRTEATYTGYIQHGKYHVAEMKAALPRVVFDEVKQRRSVGLLRELRARFPQSDIDADISAEIHALYLRAWGKFEAQAVATDSQLVATMGQLLRFAEEHDSPQVLIQFTRPTPAELSRLDAFLHAKEGGLPGVKIAQAAQYFADNSAAARETRITGGLKNAFNSIFPNDVLAFTIGKPGKKPRPVLDIAYQIEPSGAVYFSEKHKEDAFVGLKIRFQASIMVPEAPERWNFDLEVEPPQTFQVAYKTAASGGENRPAAGQVYAVMAERAFDHLDSKITAAFFRPDSAVFIRQMKRARQTGG